MHDNSITVTRDRLLWKLYILKLTVLCVYQANGVYLGKILLMPHLSYFSLILSNTLYYYTFPQCKCLLCTWQILSLAVTNALHMVVNVIHCQFDSWQYICCHMHCIIDQTQHIFTSLLHCVNDCTANGVMSGVGDIHEWITRALGCHLCCYQLLWFGNSLNTESFDDSPSTKFFQCDFTCSVW